MLPAIAPTWDLALFPAGVPVVSGSSEVPDEGGTTMLVLGTLR